jgi:hypothetical protein
LRARLKTPGARQVLDEISLVVEAPVQFWAVYGAKQRRGAEMLDHPLREDFGLCGAVDQPRAACQPLLQHRQHGR